jgi:hypothetical protein
MRRAIITTVNDEYSQDQLAELKRVVSDYLSCPVVSFKTKTTGVMTIDLHADSRKIRIFEGSAGGVSTPIGMKIAKAFNEAMVERYRHSVASHEFIKIKAVYSEWGDF